MYILAPEQAMQAIRGEGQALQAMLGELEEQRKTKRREIVTLETAWNARKRQCVRTLLCSLSRSAMRCPAYCCRQHGTLGSSTARALAHEYHENTVLIVYDTLEHLQDFVRTRSSLHCLAFSPLTLTAKENPRFSCDPEEMAWNTCQQTVRAPLMC
jgi:hypothetical protein